MKKILSILLVLVMLFGLIACGKGDTPETTAPQNPTNTAPSTEQTLPEETEVVDTLHEHTYTPTVTVPTCSEDGYTTHTCSCGESYVSDKVTAVGHNFGEWVTTLAPTEETTGAAERKCVACSVIESRVLGKLIANHVHNYTDKVISVATCNKEGEKFFTCTCGESYTEKVGKTAHDYKEKVNPPSCRGTGQKTATCTQCGDSYTEKLPKVPHDYAAATCTEPATCKSCKIQEGKSLGHSYSGGSCTRCGAKDPSQQTGPVSFTANIRSDKGKLISGVTVKVYVGETLVGTGTTDNKGVVKIELSASGSSYKILLSNVPAAYEAKESYTFSSTNISVNLKTVPVLDPNDHSQAMYKVGSTMANFVLTDTDGNTYDLSQLRQENKLIILDFWYVACNWCREEFPIFEETVKEYSGDVVFLAVNPYDTLEKIREAREEDGVNFPMLQDTLNLHKGFDVSAYPTTVFIDSDGRVVSIHSGVFDDKADFIREIKKHLN